MLGGKVVLIICPSLILPTSHIHVRYANLSVGCFLSDLSSSGAIMELITARLVTSARVKGRHKSQIDSVLA